MKSLIVLLLLSANVIAQTNSKAVDEKFGFRDIKLETTYAEFSPKGLVKSSEDGDVKIYKLKNENLAIGDYKLQSISYVFYKEKLSQIMIETKGFANSNGLLEVLKSQYGEGYKSNRYIEKYLWSGSKAGLYYNQNSINKDAVLIIFSKALQEQEQKDKDEKNKKAASKDF